MIPYITNDDAKFPSNNGSNSSTQFKLPLDELGRKKNPLSDFSSYTYNLVLYVSTPESMRDFADSGVFVPNPERDFIVCQSGGLSATDNRALTFDGKISPGAKGYDFYIDDLVYKFVVPGGKTPTAETTLDFKIIEPLGFTFLNRLSTIASHINNISSILKGDNARAALFQHSFILGIRFYGYDQTGQLISYENLEARRTGGKISRKDKYASFEKYFPIHINKLTFKLDGRETVYNISAITAATAIAGGQIAGSVKKATTIVAGTIGEALTGDGTTKNSLTAILNGQQNDEKDKNRILHRSKYSIEILDDEIKNSKVIDDADKTKADVPMVQSISRTNQSNVKTAVKVESYDSTKKNISINPGSSVISIIDNIIAKSEYVTKTLVSINNEKIETASKNNENNLFLEWYSVNPVVYPIAYDNYTNNWAYDIKYQIQKYKIPYVKSPYVSNKRKYYGSHKSYDFIFTGQNTEIISFEYNFDNLFYTVRVATTTPDGVNPGFVSNTTPMATQGGTLGQSTNQGNQNLKDAQAQSIRVNVNSIADQAIAQIKIHGDPDYLSQRLTQPRSIFESNEFEKLYGEDGYSINPYNGQIFFEIFFKYAEDYDSSQNGNGLLNIFDDIQFYDVSPAEAKQAGIKGVVYSLIEITHNFNKGLFTQDLTAVLISEVQLGLREEERVPIQQQTAPVNTTENQAREIKLLERKMEKQLPEIIEQTRIEQERRFNQAVSRASPYTLYQESLSRENNIELTGPGGRFLTDDLNPNNSRSSRSIIVPNNVNPRSNQ